MFHRRGFPAQNVQPKGLVILEDEGSNESCNGPGSPELPAEEDVYQLGGPSVVHEGDTSKNDMLMH